MKYLHYTESSKTDVVVMAKRALNMAKEKRIPVSVAYKGKMLGIIYASDSVQGIMTRYFALCPKA